MVLVSGSDLSAVVFGLFLYQALLLPTFRGTIEMSKPLIQGRVVFRFLLFRVMWVSMNGLFHSS